MRPLDPATITFVAGITSCLIGIFTFASGCMKKAERNGTIETKITQALKGIEDINHKLETSSSEQHGISLMVQSHEEQIKTLFRYYQDTKLAAEESHKIYEVLVELIHTMRKDRGEPNER